MPVLLIFCFVEHFLQSPPLLWNLYEFLIVIFLSIFCYFSHLFLAYVSFQLDSSSFSNGWIFSPLGIIYFLFPFLGFSLSLPFISCVLTTLCQRVTSAWPCLLLHGCCSSLFLFSKVLPHLVCYRIHFHPFCIPRVRGFGQALQPLPQRLKKGWNGGGW